jgi:hypothetical protein
VAGSIRPFVAGFEVTGDNGGIEFSQVGLRVESLNRFHLFLKCWKAE